MAVQPDSAAASDSTATRVAVGLGLGALVTYQVMNAIRNENQELPAGAIDANRAMIWITQEGIVYNIEKFFGWVSNTADFCGTIGQAPPPEK